MLEPGFATLNVSGLAPGTEVTLRYGEVLNTDGSVDMAWCGEPCNVGPGGGNSANQTDKYIAKGGSEPEVFTPHFTCKAPFSLPPSLSLSRARLALYPTTTGD